LALLEMSASYFMMEMAKRGTRHFSNFSPTM